MRDIRVASVQFEHAAGDKAANLAKVDSFVEKAAAQKAEIVVFPVPPLPANAIVVVTNLLPLHVVTSPTARACDRLSCRRPHLLRHRRELALIRVR